MKMRLWSWVLMLFSMVEITAQQTTSTAQGGSPPSTLLATNHTVSSLGRQTNEYGKLIDQTVDETRVEAEKGDAAAQYQLGFDYYMGQFLPQNYEEAFKWYRKAAELGYVDALCNVGVCYMEGKGVEQDYREGVKWLQKSADANCRDAQMSLGTCFSKGEGVPLDYYEAAKWFRKAAEQGHLHAQCNLGWCYHEGNGVVKDYSEAVKWFRKAVEKDYPDGQLLMGMAYARGEGVTTNHNEAAKWFRKAAERGNGTAQLRLGECYFMGQGVRQDELEAVRWLQKAAEQGGPTAQSTLGMCYISGEGVREDWNVGVKWLRKAAEQGNVTGQGGLGLAYFMGQGVTEDYVEAYKWFNLAAAKGDTNTLAFREQMLQLRRLMTPDQIAEGQRRASAFHPLLVSGKEDEFVSRRAPIDFVPTRSGTGFFITEDGFLVTNEHVVKDATEIAVVTTAGLLEAKVLRVDEANDLALLKASGKFKPIPIAPSRSVKLGSTVSTVGFPNIGLQGFSPKFAKGEIAALSGAKDDPKYFQISVPLQPGNSGGALLDERGNVVGVVSAKLSALAAIATTGQIPENVNYAVKSSLLLSFLESVPDVSASLKEPNSNSQKFDDVVQSAERAAVLVLCRTPSEVPPDKVTPVRRVPRITYLEPTPPATTTVIESQIDGDFEGWGGETIVKLTNGQIWQQTEYYYHYHYAFMPKVLVYPSAGGFKMKVDGIDRAVGVTKLK